MSSFARGETLMIGQSSGEPDRALAAAAAEIQNLSQLAQLLRSLRRRHARHRKNGELTYRQLAERTTWSQTSIAEYFTGRTLPPTDRFDVLLLVLGATTGEHRALTTARDRVDERRRRVPATPTGTIPIAQRRSEGPEPDGAGTPSPAQPAAPEPAGRPPLPTPRLLP